MEIMVDIPTEEGEFSGENQFFFSVPLSETEDLAFDCTFVGERVMKQRLKGKEKPEEEPTDIWESIKIDDGEFAERYPVKWWDRREEDKAIVNGDVWETVWKKPLPEDVKKKLSEFSSEIYEHKDNLEELKRLFEELNDYMEGIVGRFVEQ